MELSEAMMKKGNLTAEEEKALHFLATPAKPGHKVYTSVQEYLDDPDSDQIEFITEVEDIPFAVIDKAPVYPGCGTLTDNEEIKKCMSGALSARITKEFNVSVADKTGLSGEQIIYVQFKINKNGNVKNVRARAPHETLKKEAIRVISDLPRMIPGEQDGEKVGVLYSLPIKFKINE